MCEEELVLSQMINHLYQSKNYKVFLNPVVSYPPPPHPPTQPKPGRDVPLGISRSTTRDPLFPYKHFESLPCLSLSLFISFGFSKSRQFKNKLI